MDDASSDSASADGDGSNATAAGEGPPMTEEPTGDVNSPQGGTIGSITTPLSQSQFRQPVFRTCGPTHRCAGYDRLCPHDGSRVFDPPNRGRRIRRSHDPLPRQRSGHLGLASDRV